MPPPPPQAQHLYVELLIPKVMVLGNGDFRGVGYAGGALMSEIGALMKETTMSSIALLPCEGTVAICEPGSRSLPDAKPASALILDFPVSRTVRNTCLLFKSPGLW